MKINIGEIVNIIIPFTTSMNLSIYGSFPVITSSIGNNSATTKLYMSIMQTSENFYSIAITDDIYNGNKFIPTGNINKPFIREKYFLGGDFYESECFKNIEGKDFQLWFYNKLYEYNIIRFNPKNYNKKLIDLGFNSGKIKRILDKNFKKLHYINGSISDLINITNDKEIGFSLSGLEDKEIRCIYAKIKNLGLEIVIFDNKITKVKYDRRN